jgi:hypothetical protein
VAVHREEITMEIPKIVTKAGLGMAAGLLATPLLVAPAFVTTVTDDGSQSIVAGAYKKMSATDIEAGAYKKMVTPGAVVS